MYQSIQKFTKGVALLAMFGLLTSMVPVGVDQAEALTRAEERAQDNEAFRDGRVLKQALRAYARDNNGDYPGVWPLANGSTPQYYEIGEGCDGTYLQLSDFLVPNYLPDADLSHENGCYYYVRMRHDNGERVGFGGGYEEEYYFTHFMNNVAKADRRQQCFTKSPNHYAGTGYSCWAQL